MPISTIALKGKFGSTNYYVTSMSALEVSGTVRVVKETDVWSADSIDVRLQREPNLTRIKNQIAPYLANNKDRFFGSIIVLAHGSKLEFEALKDLDSKLPTVYQNQAERIGFLTIAKGNIICLDGQHRLLAIQAAMGVASKTQDIKINGKYVNDIPNDQITVIFIEHESNEKTRSIFNTINRYAKPTSRGDNIITSEDDGHAILARELLSKEGPFDIESVNWKSNTLTERMTKFSTISVLHSTSKIILDAYDITFANQERPSDEILEESKQHLFSFWKKVLKGIDAYNSAMKRPSAIPEMRKNGSYSLLFKPAAQISLVSALVRATSEKKLIAKLSLSEAIERANQLNWDIEDLFWKGVIIKESGAIDAGPEGRKRAANLIFWMIAGEYFDKDLTLEAKIKYNEGFGIDLIKNPEIKHKSLPNLPKF